MANQSDKGVQDDEPGEPTPDYQYHDFEKRMHLEKLGALGIITPNGPWRDVDLDETFERVWQDHASAYTLDFDGPPRRSIEFHTPWFARDEAVENVKSMPYLEEHGFDPDRVAEAISQLPPDVRVVIGRELDPVIYVWTDRVALVGGLMRKASGKHVYPGMVSYFPSSWEGEEACACAEFEGSWNLVRVVWNP